MTTVGLDQLRNAYYLTSMFMRVYLVDVILNVAAPTKILWTTHHSNGRVIQAIMYNSKL